MTQPAQRIARGGVVRKALLACGALSILMALGLGAAWWLAARSLPHWAGQKQGNGLTQPIDVVRDRYAVPHVFAQTSADAYWGLGYVHAQDRLWQMELNRRLGAGALAEVFGPDALPRDRLFRTLGLRRAAEQSLRHLDASTLGILEAYARGVNAFLAEEPALPPEFGLLGVRPAAWTVADSLMLLKVMAWNLSSNLDSELWRWRLSGRLSPPEIAEFLAPYPGDEPVQLGEGLPMPGPPSPTGQRWTPAGSVNVGLGSNSWVVDGRATESGKPLLANDPHLGLTSPSVWYLAHLHAPDLDVIGATLPSVPAIILGHNASVAWSFTNTGSDTQDLVLERLVPGDASRYQTPAGALPFTVIREMIGVKGEPAELLDVRLTRNGPVISDVHEQARELLPEGHVLALRWTALEPDDRTLDFSTEVAKAENAADVLRATRHFHSPPQNIVYADAAGEVGFVAAGRVPKRRPDNPFRGLLPGWGWDGRFEWDGFIPVEAVPARQNPESGRIVTANQKITPPGYAHWLGAEWAEPYRAERIDELLDGTSKHSVASFAHIQQDVQSGSARVLIPLLLRAMQGEQGALDTREQELLARLASWNMEMLADDAEPLVFGAWVRELAREVYADELGELFESAWAERVSFLANVLSNRADQGSWCDDVGSERAEACPERVRRAFQAALRDLRDRFGSDESDWSWGRAHLARARHFPMSRVPVLRSLFETVVPSNGGMHTVNVGAYFIDDSETPFESRHAASFRAVYDLGNLGASRFMLSTGQSGHVLSPHYRDWVAPWQRGELVPMLTERAAIEAGALGVLNIAPLP